MGEALRQGSIGRYLQRFAQKAVTNGNAFQEIPWYPTKDPHGEKHHVVLITNFLTLLQLPGERDLNLPHFYWLKLDRRLFKSPIFLDGEEAFLAGGKEVALF